jgi:hypothetical protein
VPVASDAGLYREAVGQTSPDVAWTISAAYEKGRTRQIQLITGSGQDRRKNMKSKRVPWFLRGRY